MSDWCETENTDIGGLGFVKKKDIYGNWVIDSKYPKKVRCPKCRKQLETFTRSCHDDGCIHVYMPKHKAPVKKIKKGTRDVVRGCRGK